MTHHSKYDVVIVGGGPAGSTLATLLAQHGWDVMLLERETFPRYHVGESLISGLVPVMRELGVEEELDRRYQWKFGVSLVWGNEPDPWRTGFNEASPFDHSWHVDRASFDELLLDNAARKGVHVVQGARVTSTHTDPTSKRVTGLRYTHEGSAQDVWASYVVDASGQSRVVSRHLTDVQWHEDLRNVAIWQYFDGYRPLAEAGDILVEAVPSVGGWLWGIPVSDDRLSVGYVSSADSVSAALAGGRTQADLLQAALAASKEAKKMIADAEPVDGLRTARDVSHAADTFSGPGWVAVGDAAAFVDPLFSSGVWLGTSGAWLAAKALDACLRQPDEEANALNRYEQVYRQIVTDMLAYVRYFSDPHRAKEDYFEKAQAASKVFAENSQLGFVAFISGITALPGILNFDPLGEKSVEQVLTEAVNA